MPGCRELSWGWLPTLAPDTGCRPCPGHPAHLILQLVHTVCLLRAALHELRWVIILMVDWGAAQEKVGVRLAICSSHALAQAPGLASLTALSVEPCSGYTRREGGQATSSRTPSF